jgi:hypothetical protein
MPALTARSPLIVDATPDLKRVDQVMTRIISDRTTWNDFFRDPNGVLIKAGLHPPTTAENNSRANEIFYAVLCNKPLIKQLTRLFKKYRPSRARVEKFEKTYLAGLQQGEIRHDLGQDIDAISHVVSDSDALRAVLRLALHDINRRGILQEKHSRKEIDDYLDRIVKVAVTGKSLRKEPPLESWDRSYGIGKAFGGFWLEVVGIVTVGAAAQIAAVVTLCVGGDLQLPRATLDEMIAGARGGDTKQTEALAMYGKLLAFSGELMMHVANFESSR